MAEAQVYGKPTVKKNKKDLSLQIKNNKKKEHVLEPQIHGSMSTMNYKEAPLCHIEEHFIWAPRSMWCFMGKLVKCSLFI